MIADISLAYSPQVHAFKPLITNAGIEYLTVAFPLTKYPGHLMVSSSLSASCRTPPNACHDCPSCPLRLGLGAACSIAA
jgi:hypothetical protein